MNELREEDARLWSLIVSPTIWLVHFLATYITYALTCRSADASLDGARWAVAAYTAVALIVIAVLARRAYRRHRYKGATGTHDFDTHEDRHRFLGFATLLLSVLSGVAVVYDAVPALFFGSCR